MTEMVDKETGRHPDVFEFIDIVLVHTSHSGNIGAVARAMKNMGFGALKLVSPKDFPSDDAVARAAGACDVLDSATVFGSLSEAVADCHYVVGASARVRSFPWPVMNPRETAQKAMRFLAESDGGALPTKVALVFGRESSGLTNEELHQCNAHVHIPANPDYSSLNLAMAVQVLTYELRMQILECMDGGLDAPVLGPDDLGWDAEPCSTQDIEGLMSHLTNVMTRTGFYDEQNPGQLQPRLRRLFQRRTLDKMELNILRGILKSVEKKLQR
jgi:tRNA (cytidine32/uridine32-2'-O)-methyltransferase